MWPPRPGSWLRPGTPPQPPPPAPTSTCFSAPAPRRSPCWSWGAGWQQGVGGAGTVDCGRVPGTAAPSPPGQGSSATRPGLDRLAARAGRAARRGGDGRGAGPGCASPAVRATPGPRPAEEQSACPGVCRVAGAAGTLAMRTLWMALCALARLWPGAQAGCAEAGRCCPGRDPAYFARGWRLDRVYGTCFCDQACRLTGDCCFDYDRACPARPCFVGEWSPWSGCADQCKPTTRVRRRSVQQEPQNGGAPCPPLEERAGCLEYSTPQGQNCGHSYVPAFITTSAFNKERTRQATSPHWSTHTEDAGYCMEFKTESLTPHCALENRPLTRWMQYLREGYTVCVDCQPPAMNSVSLRCSGDGLDSDGNQTLHWQAIGNPRCQGTWKKVRRVDQCSCPAVHSFIFI
uniref:Somatomedin B and thrombospondin type 1 domain containing n=2 Tax=Macaca TaxID=9539 RepID=A0A7N9IC21_MACFA